HGIKKIAGLCWRTRTSLSASHDDFGRDLGKRLVASGLDEGQEDVLALPPGRRREGCPCGGFPVAGNGPPKGAESPALDALWAPHAGDGGLVLGVELRGAEGGADANARAFANSHVPHHAPVSGDLPGKVRWSRAWHGADHRTISEDSSRAGISVP